MNMRPNPEFLNLPHPFWADVRTISQKIGYQRGGVFAIPSPRQVVEAYIELGLNPGHLVTEGEFTDGGAQVVAYLRYRGLVISSQVKPQLMDAKAAKSLFEDTAARLNPIRSPQPMNKQSGEKRAPAYLTCLVNMLIEHEIGSHPCDFDPRELTSITRHGRPLRTLARRMDGAFPSANNPIAVWEIKEYYYTTTFGSRIADGVYETMLDGLELMELREHEGIEVEHILIVDAFETWWEMGKSYLCRMIDMLHMGHVSEVLFGREVVDRLPTLARLWVSRLP